MALPTLQEILSWARKSRKMGPRAVAALDEMRKQAGEEWSSVALPPEIMTLPLPLVALCKSGIDLRLDRFEHRNAQKSQSLRTIALWVDAPLQTHQFLDSIGEPCVSWEYISHNCLHFIDRIMLNSLSEVQREEPVKIRETVSARPSIAALRALDAHFKKNSRASRVLMQWVNDLGADWQEQNIQHLIERHAKATASFDRIAFDAFLVELHANHLDAVSCNAQSSSVRPRL